LDAFLGWITELVREGFRFLGLMFRSRMALSAEILFLRKQLAFYEERQVEPRRLNDSARFSLALWSRLFNWKDALVIVKPETLIGWHRKGFTLFWRRKTQGVARDFLRTFKSSLRGWRGRTRRGDRLAWQLSYPSSLESISLRVRYELIGLPSRGEEARAEPLRNAGGPLSAITLSPWWRAILWSW
jgi:hypothetical protein